MCGKTARRDLYGGRPAMGGSTVMLYEIMKKITHILNWITLAIVSVKLGLLIVKPPGKTVVTIGGEGDSLYPVNVFIPDPLNYLTALFYILILIVLVMNIITVLKQKKANQSIEAIVTTPV